MIGVTQIGILTAGSRHAVGQFRPDEPSHKRDAAAGKPCAQNQCGRMDALGDYIGIYEDPCTNDAAHHQHGHVEESQPAGQSLCRTRVCLLCR